MSNPNENLDEINRELGKFTSLAGGPGKGSSNKSQENQGSLLDRLKRIPR